MRHSRSPPSRLTRGSAPGLWWGRCPRPPLWARAPALAMTIVFPLFLIYHYTTDGNTRWEAPVLIVTSPSHGQSPNVSEILGTSYMGADSTRNSKCILHGNETRYEEHFCRVDHECWRAIYLFEIANLLIVAANRVHVLMMFVIKLMWMLRKLCIRSRPVSRDESEQELAQLQSIPVPSVAESDGTGT